MPHRAAVLAARLILFFISLSTIHPALSANIYDIGGTSASSLLPKGINASGQVVGNFQDGASHPFLYAGGKLTILQSINGTGNAINDAGQIAGRAHNSAYTYLEGGLNLIVNEETGIISGYAEAYGINNAGQVVGNGGSYINTRSSFTFLYSMGKQLYLPLDLPCCLDTYSPGASATAINSSGHVVGVSATSDFFYRSVSHAPFFDGQHTLDLGTLPGDSDSAAYALNDKDQIVGVSASRQTGQRHAFLYSDQMMRDIGSLPGYDAQSTAQSINNEGQIAGWSQNSAGVQKAFFYSGGALQDLNSFLPANSGWNLQTALAINDSGQIAGVGTLDGVTHAYLLDLSTDPVPPGQLATTLSPMSYLSQTQTSSGDLTITNTGATTLSGPLRLTFDALSVGAVLSNATSTLYGAPYVTVPVASLAPGESATVNLQFKNPWHVPITFSPQFSTWTVQ